VNARRAAAFKWRGRVGSARSSGAPRPIAAVPLAASRSPSVARGEEATPAASAPLWNINECGGGGGGALEWGHSQRAARAVPAARRSQFHAGRAGTRKKNRPLSRGRGHQELLQLIRRKLVFGRVVAGELARSQPPGGGGPDRKLNTLTLARPHTRTRNTAPRRHCSRGARCIVSRRRAYLFIAPLAGNPRGAMSSEPNCSDQKAHGDSPYLGPKGFLSIWRARARVHLMIPPAGITSASACARACVASVRVVRLVVVVVVVAVAVVVVVLVGCVAVAAK
jgi:hypothetical protein